MAATVLVTTKNDCPLFLEEPESFLHAGVQRYLIEKLYEDGRQVFVATHSPTFLNSSRPKSVHQISLKSGRSYVSRIDTDSIAEVVADIGIRNSDVLFSDAIVFVEGPGDREVLMKWCQTLGVNLAEKNISIIPMGGGDFSNKRVYHRKEILEAIAGNAGVPHLFVFDHDERTQDEVDELNKKYNKIVYCLKKRELENYLLEPEALIAAIRDKLISKGLSTALVDNAKVEELRNFINVEANNLYGVVLLKRIRSQFLQVKNAGLFPRKLFEGLTKKADDKKLNKLLESNLKKNAAAQLRAVQITKVVSAERRKLNKEWKKTKNLLSIAPGSELVEAVYKKYGVEYSKPADTKNIAGKLRVEQIPAEIKELINRIKELRHC